MNTLSIGATVNLKDQSFEVIGIDDYQLANNANGQCSWLSYTLLSAAGERTWISYGVAGDLFTQWSEVEQADYQELAKSATVDLDLSGIAKISFSGDMGHSTPDAELVWSRINETNAPEFLVIERFLSVTDNGLQPLKPYFQTGTILKDFHLD